MAAASRVLHAAFVSRAAPFDTDPRTFFDPMSPLPASPSPRPPKATLVHILALVGLALGLVGHAACGSQEEVTEADRQAIRTTLEEYLPALAEGYTSGDLEPLREWAAEKEVARAFSRVDELAQEGRYVEPELESMTIEDIVVWGHANAYVTTLEVWDLRLYANGSATPLGEELDQTSRVKYQLKRRGDRWQVLHRELFQTIEPSS